MILHFLGVIICLNGVVSVLADSCVCFQEPTKSSKHPVFLQQTTDDTKRFLLVDQSGIVHSYTSSWEKSKESFIDISSLAEFDHHDDQDYERGALGLALHPDFKNNKKYYVYYVREFNDKRYAFVSQFIEKHGGSQDTGSETVLIAVSLPSHQRNGGGLLFGADGYLYISVGDGGIANNTGNEQMAQQAQRGDTLLGKILRIDVDKQDIVNNRLQPYAIPGDNPFLQKSNWLPEIYAYGCRNMFRCSIDHGSPKKEMFCADTGNHDMEEVDIIEKGGNYGWNLREGTKCLQPHTCNGTLQDEVLPIYAYDHSKSSQSAAIGGYVYRGNAFPGLQGRYIFGDHNGTLMQLVKNNSNSVWSSLGVTPCAVNMCPCNARQTFGVATFIRSFSQDNNGELYVLTSSFKDGQLTSSLLKLVPPSVSVVTCGACSSSIYLSGTWLYVIIVGLIWR